MRTFAIAALLGIASVSGIPINGNNKTTTIKNASVGIPTGPNVHHGAYVSCNRPGVFAFTFDDGPSELSWNLATELNKQGVKATFFIVGDSYVNVETGSIQTNEGVKTYFDVMKHYVDMGHELASHTYQHKNVESLSSSDLKFQMSKVSDLIFKATGERPALMRPPTGSYDDKSLKELASLGYRIVLWDIDSRDWESHNLNSEIAAYKIMESDTPSTLGHIALQHETYEQTVEELVPAAIKYVKTFGYEFVTVSDCLGVPAYQ